MMKRGAISINGGSWTPGLLIVEQELVDVGDVTSMVPDPAWTLFDELGHFHAYGADGDLPTLDRREFREPGECGYRGCDDCLSLTRVEYTCRICRELVTPRQIPADRDRVVPGMKTWTLRVERWFLLGEQMSAVCRTHDDGLNGLEYFGVALVQNVVVTDTGAVTFLLGNGPLGVRRSGA